MGALKTRDISRFRDYECSKDLRDKRQLLCDMIERRMKKPVSIHMAKHKTRWCACTCLLCGEHMDVVTHYHAQMHGYESADALVKAGCVRFD